MTIITRLHDGARIETIIEGRFTIESDQPAPIGEDKAPSPFDVFLASVAACTGYFAQRYCRKWKLPHEGIEVVLEPVWGERHSLERIRMSLVVPPGFPAEHREGLLRNAGHCPVKKVLETSPPVELTLAEAAIAPQAV